MCCNSNKFLFSTHCTKKSVSVIVFRLPVWRTVKVSRRQNWYFCEIGKNTRHRNRYKTAPVVPDDLQWTVSTADTWSRHRSCICISHWAWHNSRLWRTRSLPGPPGFSGRKTLYRPRDSLCSKPKSKLRPGVACEAWDFDS